MTSVSSIAIETLDSGDLALPPDAAGSPSHVESHEAKLADDATADRLQFWESEHTRPGFKSSNETDPELVAAADNYLGACLRHPYLPVSEIRAQQLARIKELVELAYREIPVYRAKYQAAGFKPEHLRDWDEIQKIPVIT